jgi:hypothetical protein
MGNNNLFAGDRMPPLLMAPGNTNPKKAMLAKNSDHLV